MTLVVKNPPAEAGDMRDAGSTPGWGRSPGEDMAILYSILAWRIPWTEEPWLLWVAKSQTQQKQLSTHTLECQQDPQGPRVGLGTSADRSMSAEGPADKRHQHCAVVTGYALESLANSSRLH